MSFVVGEPRLARVERESEKERCERECLDAHVDEGMGRDCLRPEEFSGVLISVLRNIGGTLRNCCCVGCKWDRPRPEDVSGVSTQIQKGSEEFSGTAPEDVSGVSTLIQKGSEEFSGTAPVNTLRRIPPTMSAIAVGCRCSQVPLQSA